jgi:hypothetical protein
MGISDEECIDHRFLKIACRWVLYMASRSFFLRHPLCTCRGGRFSGGTTRMEVRLNTLTKGSVVAKASHLLHHPECACCFFRRSSDRSFWRK